VCHLDEAGFAMTLPTSYSWYPVGQRLCIDYEAPQGRRVNALGAYFSHGPLVGRFDHATFASVPRSRARSPRQSLAEVAAAHGLQVEEVGPIEAERFLSFVWHIAGRPAVHTWNWKRDRPLVIVLDNYSVHKSQVVQEAIPNLEAAHIRFFYLPSYSPELSHIEAIWHSVKQHGMPQRSYSVLGDLKRAVDEALCRKAHELQQAHAQTTNFQRLAA
jgi:hypothetical protein